MKKAFKLRGVMLDLARVTENKDYYRRLLPDLARWGYNLLHLHLIDDERCALAFPSHPELATPGAFSVAEMRSFLDLARRRGLAALPEIETLGHSRLIFTHPRHRELAEPRPAAGGVGHYHSLCPGHPGTRRLLADLLRDTAEIFDHPVIHVGLDEVQLGACPRCRRRFGAGAPDWRRYAEHARWVHAEVRRLGRRPAMWADHVVKETAILKGFRRDVLMFQWDYNPEYAEGRAKLLLDAGFEVAACPATARHGTVFAPLPENVTNLRNCSARSLPQRPRGLVGLVNTVWCPYRYLPGAIDYVLALAGHLFTAMEEDPSFAERFARDFYGLAPAAAGTAAAALRAVFEDGFGLGMLRKLLIKQAPRPGITREDRRLYRLVAGRLQTALAALRRERRGVRRHRPRYDDLLLSVEALLAAARFGAADRKRSAVRSLAGLARRFARAWDRDRQPADPWRRGCTDRWDSMFMALKTISGGQP